MMLEQWNKSSLEDIATVSGGSATPKGEKKFEEGTYPFIRTSDLSKIRFGTIYDSRDKLNNSGIKNMKFFKKGTILLSSTGASTLLNYRVMMGVDGYVSNTLTCVIANEKIVNKKFLHYALLRIKAQDYVPERAYPGLKMSTIKSFQISYPSLAEQQRIVSILDEVFVNAKQSTISLQSRLDNINFLFQSIFLTVTKNSSAWENKMVEELLFSEKGSIRTGPFGSQLLHSEFVDEGIAVLGIDNAVKNEFRWGKRRFITEEKYSQLSRYTVKPGDVIITIMGTCGRCAIIPDDIPMAINTKHLCCITLDTNKCLPEYLHAYFLHHPLSLEYLNKMAKGSVMDGLNMGIIRKLPVLLPRISEQQKIIDKLNMVSNEIKKLQDSYQTELESQTELKQSILQEALNGNLTKEITS